MITPGQDLVAIRRAISIRVGIGNVGSKLVLF